METLVKTEFSRWNGKHLMTFVQAISDNERQHPLLVALLEGSGITSNKTGRKTEVLDESLLGQLARMV